MTFEAGGAGAVGLEEALMLLLEEELEQGQALGLGQLFCRAQDGLRVLAQAVEDFGRGGHIGHEQSRYQWRGRWWQSRSASSIE